MVLVLIQNFTTQSPLPITLLQDNPQFHANLQKNRSAIPKLQASLANLVKTSVPYGLDHRPPQIIIQLSSQLL